MVNQDLADRFLILFIDPNNKLVVLQKHSIIIADLFDNRTPAFLALPMALMESIAAHKPIKGHAHKIIHSQKTLMFDSYPLSGDNKAYLGTILVIYNAPSVVYDDGSEYNNTLTRSELFEILDNTPDGVFVTDQNGYVQYTNNPCKALIGADNLDIVGMHVDDLEAMGLFTDSAINRVRETRQQVTMFQKSKTDLLVTAKPLYDENGNITRIISNSRDIGDITHLQNELTAAKQLADYYQSKLSKLERENKSLENIICKSASMKSVVERIRKVSEYDTSVLLLGESGVGKTIFAKLIHQLSPRSNEGFVYINCGAIPENLLESELFGYEEGAFSGAKKTGHIGKIELAHKGTLFLDEISEMSVALQAKLLHVLNDKKITRVGGNKVIEIDFRLLTATHQDLNQLVRAGRFREDLFYRINVIKLIIPPLRDRQEDIPHLINYYLEELNKKYGMNKRITKEAHMLLANYSFPGNVRELINLLEHLYVISDRSIITDMLAASVMQAEMSSNETQIMNNEKSDNTDLTGLKTYANLLENFEKDIFTQMFSKYNSSYKVADILKISQSTANRKIQKYCRSPADNNQR